MRESFQIRWCRQKDWIKEDHLRDCACAVLEMRWRVKKGGKLYSRGNWNEAGLEVCLVESVVEGAIEGARAVLDGAMEGG